MGVSSSAATRPAPVSSLDFLSKATGYFAPPATSAAKPVPTVDWEKEVPPYVLEAFLLDGSQPSVTAPSVFTQADPQVSWDMHTIWWYHGSHNGFGAV